jgi:OPA family glycerol-3-phosphate transporter-like MFS transporter
MLIGLQAIDLADPHVAGTSAGFTGLFGYCLGATLASTGVGYIVEHFGWNTSFIVELICVVCTIIFLVLILPREQAAIAHQKALAAELNK